RRSSRQPHVPPPGSHGRVRCRSVDRRSPTTQTTVRSPANHSDPSGDTSSPSFLLLRFSGRQAARAASILRFGCTPLARAGPGCSVFSVGDMDLESGRGADRGQIDRGEIGTRLVRQVRYQLMLAMSVANVTGVALVVLCILW